MVYKITPANDSIYIEEFRRQTIGTHSPGLQRVLNVMRLYRGGIQYVLVCRQPFCEFSIGRMAEDRSTPIEIEAGPGFGSREEAEWALFCRRWHEHTGETIATPYRDPDRQDNPPSKRGA